MATSASTVAAAVVARARREIREHFERNDAFSVERAVAYDPPDRVHRLQFEALVGRAILRPTGNGTYWFDREAERAVEERQRAAGILILKIALIVFAIGIAAAVIMPRLR